jgi:diacylglycerol O-acyltransferase / wax synthase
VDTPAWFERIGPGDAQQLATDVGPVPANVGAALLLDAGPAADAAALADVLANRLGTIPRMRQRLRAVPLGCGRPVWVDDPRFEPQHHVEIVDCAAPGDLGALLDIAVATVTRPLDRSRPLWRVRIVTGLSDGRVGVVLALHHVLADGMGGLALLAGLVDGIGEGWGAQPPPRPEPSPRALRADAARSRWRALRRAPRAAAALRPALTELGRDRPERAPRCSLNAPTGPRRRARVVTVELAPLQRAARDSGATVNDVLLVAVARAIGSVLRSRGECVPDLVISVPVSARTTATTERLGNQVGVMPVRVPATRTAEEALVRVARTTAARRTEQRGTSAALIAPAFRALAALRLFRPMIDRQRLVNSFLTNMRGPERPATIAGASVRLVAPVTIATGNVSVAFAALSYAGALSITVMVDPDLVPELDLLVKALADELRLLGRRGVDLG